MNNFRTYSVKQNRLIRSVLFILMFFVSLSCDDTDYTYVPEPQPDIIVSGFSPNIGDIGYQVRIEGEHFSPLLSNNKVRFNGVLATVISGDENSLMVEVPEGASTGSLTISHLDVTIDAGTFSVVDIPVIESFSPTAGEVGDQITILGTKFGNSSANVQVSFNGVTATVVSSSDTEIVVEVPDGATSGPITVTVNGQSDVTDQEFIVAKSFVVAISDGDDDVEEVAVDFGDPVGTMDLSSSDLELGEISSGQGLMNIGLRFNQIAIPANANIIEAKIQFRTDNEGSNPVELTIWGELTGNALAYTEDLGNLSARTLTNANAVWAVEPWLEAGDRGEAQQTINIASIIQEIINHPDWASGNSLNIIMKNTGVSATATSSSGGREAEDFSSSTPEDAAELVIVYNE